MPERGFPEPSLDAFDPPTVGPPSTYTATGTYTPPPATSSGEGNDGDQATETETATAWTRGTGTGTIEEGSVALRGGADPQDATIELELGLREQPLDERPPRRYAGRAVKPLG